MSKPENKGTRTEFKKTNSEHVPLFPPSAAGNKVLGRGLKDLAAIPLAPIFSSPLMDCIQDDVPADIPAVKLPRVVVVASGKGGTGKSFLSVNLACGLGQQDQKVLLIDADFGLANAHLLLGLNPRHDISHLIMGSKTLREVLAPAPCNVTLLSGCSGIAELSALSYEQFRIFVSELRKAEQDFDWIIVDTSAGISPQVMSFVTAAVELIMVVNPEATSMLDAYAMMKTLFLRNPHAEVGFVANRVKDSIMAKEVYKKLNGAAEHYLKKSLVDMGFVVFDAAVGNSITNRRPLLMDEPRSDAAFCLKKIVQKVFESKRKSEQENVESYFVRLQREVAYWQNGRSVRKGANPWLTY